MKKRLSVFLVVIVLVTAAAPALALGYDEDYALIEPMMPVLDSLVRTIDAEYVGEYAPYDPDFFWTTLYLMAANYGYLHPFYEDLDGIARLPRQAMQEFATGAFLEYDDLLPISELMEGAIWYDPAYDAYTFFLSDPGTMYTEIGAYEFMEGGVVYVRVDMYDGEVMGDPLGAYLVILEPNPYEYVIADPLFIYSVSDVQRIEG